MAFLYPEEPEDYYLSYECENCDDKQEKIDCIKELLQSLIIALYSDENLDENQFEECLDMIAHHVNIDLPKRPLQIERKSQSIKDIQFLLHRLSL